MVQSKAWARIPQIGKTLFELLTFGTLSDANQVYRTSDGAMEKGFSESLFITVNTEIIAVSRDLIFAWRKKCRGKYLNYFLSYTLYISQFTESKTVTELQCWFWIWFDCVPIWVSRYWQIRKITSLWSRSLWLFSWIKEQIWYLATDT